MLESFEECPQRVGILCFGWFTGIIMQAAQGWAVADVSVGVRGGGWFVTDRLYHDS